MRLTTMLVRAFIATLALTALGCGGPTLIPRAEAPDVPLEAGQTKCSVAASSNNPLVTEWPASEKANLEVKLREGAVAVAYSGCDMRLIPECRLGGSYQWLRTTVSTDRLEIRNEDDLYARLPIGAISLEGELRAAGKLAVQTTVSGQVRLTGLRSDTLEQSAACSEATHVLTAMTVGAFELTSGGELKAGASVEAPVVGAGVSTESSEEKLRSAGDASRCAESTDQSPHSDCRSPIQMFLQPLPWHAAGKVPAGKSRVSFASGGGSTQWEVHVGGQPLCTTPCTRDIPKNSSMTMRQSKKDRMWPEVDASDLGELSSADQLEVRAIPTSTGLAVTGITFTALGGIATVVGTVLTPVGCSDVSSREGICTAGVVTGGVGLAVMIPAIIMISLGRSHAEIVDRTATTEPGWTLGAAGPEYRF